MLPLRWIIALVVTLSPCHLVTLSLRAQDENPWVVYEGRRRPRQGQARRPRQRRRGVPLRGSAAAARQDPRQASRLQVHRPLRHRPEDRRRSTRTSTTTSPAWKRSKTADLMIIATRFRNLPDEQMKHIVDYVESGKPIIGLRTATHAFNGMQGQVRQVQLEQRRQGLRQGFGRQVLGETWISHHGNHGKQSTRGIIAKDAGEASDPARASRTATSGARPTSTASACRCPATASRWCWARCWSA